MEWDWAMIKTLAGARPVSHYEVITSKQHWRALLLSHWSSSLSLVPNFLNASSGGKCDIFLTFRYKHIARRLASNINLYMACYKTPHFLFQRTLFLFQVHFSCYIFLFPSLDEKEITSIKKWTAFLSYLTILCIMTQFSPAPVRFDDYYSGFFFESLNNFFLSNHELLTHIPTFPLSPEDFLHHPLFLL